MTFNNLHILSLDQEKKMNINDWIGQDMNDSDDYGGMLKC